MLLSELDFVWSPVCETCTTEIACGMLVVQRFSHTGQPFMYNIYVYRNLQQAAYALDNRSRNSPEPMQKWVRLGELEAQMVLFEVTKDEAL